jgi:hypothetical protein
LLPLYRLMLGLYARHPLLCRRLFGAARPFAMVRPSPRLRPMFLKFLQPCDAASLRDAAAFDACFESARRAWRGSAAGVMTDAEVYAQPWGFRLEDVNVPVQLWHGVKDRAFAVRWRSKSRRGCRMRGCDWWTMPGITRCRFATCTTSCASSSRWIGPHCRGSCQLPCLC